VILKAVSDIKGGKWFGPVSMGRGVLSIEGRPFSRFKALCIYSIPQAIRVTRIGLHHRYGLHCRGAGPTVFNRQKIKVSCHEIM
jgi:hypothetical protein